MGYSQDRQEIKYKKTLESLYGRTSATSLDAAILNFLSDLELTDIQSNLVATRQKAVRERAENNALVDVEDSLLIGSYARDTQIKALLSSGPIDVDCLLVLKTSTYNVNKYWHANDGGKRLLEDIQRSLQGYQGLTVKIDSPAITINWSDMKMELIPAFHRQEGGYLIPAANVWSNTWQSTSPIKDADHFTELNKIASGEFKPMIKMLKCWNRTYNKVVGSSFALETALYHSIGSSFVSFESEITRFFKKLSEYNYTSLEAPSRVGKAVTIELTTEKLKIVTGSESVIRNAFALANQGRHKEAINNMALVFGKPFEGAV